MKRRRLTQEEREAMYRESLARATQSQALSNYAPIISGFMERGIPEAEILPRENVFTFNAWKAKGRYVKRGEHGVRITTWVPTKGSEEALEGAQDGEETKVNLRPVTAVVFHVSQTEAREDNAARREWDAAAPVPF